jgi:hypothetical protein
MENLSVGARELALYIENDARLYESQWKPIQKNLTTKKAQGKYQKEGAVKLFGYLMDAAAKNYAIEHGDSALWSKMFPKHDRLQAAKYFVELFEQGWKNGDFADYVPKKYQAKKAAPKSSALLRRAVGYSSADLFDYHTGELIRTATRAELKESKEAARFDGGAGVFEIDGRSVYVQ